MFGSYQMYFIVKFVASCKNEDDAKLSYEVALLLLFLFFQLRNLGQNTWKKWNNLVKKTSAKMKMTPNSVMKLHIDSSSTDVNSRKGNT